MHLLPHRDTPFLFSPGIDDGADVDPQLVAGIYERVRAQEFRAGADHVTPVLKVQQTIIGKKPVRGGYWRVVSCPVSLTGCRV